MLFCLDAPVENGTVSALTQNILMQTALTALTLHPEVAVLLFQSSQFLFSLDVDLFHLHFAVIANYVLVSFEQIFAAETRFLHDGELKDA